jgi:hypothetical protein
MVRRRDKTDIAVPMDDRSSVGWMVEVVALFHGYGLL